MLRIKFFAMTLVVGLAGVVYAAGNTQDAAQHQHHGAQTADKAACCQAGHHQGAQKDGQKHAHHAAMSCDKDGGDCCKGHKADAKQHSAKAEGESCCAGGGGGCCKGHQQKAGEGAAVVKASTTEAAASCCGEGAACCKDGAACCKAHRAAGQTAAAGEKHEGCCGCCGDSCDKHAGR